MVILEFLIIYIPNNKPDYMNPIYKEMKMDDEQYNVIELPLKKTLFNSYLYYRRFHNKRLVGSYVYPPNYYSVNIPYLVRFTQDVLKQDLELPKTIDPKKESKNVRFILNSHNVRWVILHKTWPGYHIDYPEWDDKLFYENKRLIENLLKIGPTYEDEELVAYKIEKLS